MPARRSTSAAVRTATAEDALPADGESVVEPARRESAPRRRKLFRRSNRWCTAARSARFTRQFARPGSSNIGLQARRVLISSRRAGLIPSIRASAVNWPGPDGKVGSEAYTPRTACPPTTRTRSSTSCPYQPASRLPATTPRRTVGRFVHKGRARRAPRTSTLLARLRNWPRCSVEWTKPEPVLQQRDQWRLHRSAIRRRRFFRGLPPTISRDEPAPRPDAGRRLPAATCRPAPGGLGLDVHARAALPPLALGVGRQPEDDESLKEARRGWKTRSNTRGSVNGTEEGRNCRFLESTWAGEKEARRSAFRCAAARGPTRG